MQNLKQLMRVCVCACVLFFWWGGGVIQVTNSVILCNVTQFNNFYLMNMLHKCKVRSYFLFMLTTYRDNQILITILSIKCSNLRFSIF